MRGNVEKGVVAKKDFWSLYEEGSAGFAPVVASARPIEEARVPVDQFHYNMCALRVAKRTLEVFRQSALFWSNATEAGASVRGTWFGGYICVMTAVM